MLLPHPLHTRSRAPFLAAAVALIITSLPSAQEVQRPKHSFLRQNEDWSAYGRAVDLDATGDPLDRIKYIPLNEDGDVWLSLGGHARARYEGWNNFNFGLMPGVGHDDAFLLTRFLLHADLHLGDSTRVFAEGKTAQSTNRDLPGGTRTLDVDSLDVQQLFVDQEFETPAGALTLRLGRQMLSLGKQRLVSPLPWGNTLRTWDGVSAFWKGDAWNVHAFWADFAPVDIGDFNESGAGQELYGAYATLNSGEGPALDLYVLGSERRMASFNGTSGRERRTTLGVRASDKLADAKIDYDVELAYQFGEVGPGDVSAWMLGATAGYTLDELPTDPHLRVGLDMASGDDSAGGDVETFNQLYPLGHAYLGFMDHVGRQNVIDASLGADLKLSSKWQGRIDLHQFFLMSADDALYNAGGGVVVPGSSGASRTVGTELDVTTRYRVDRHLALSAGYGHFFAGSRIDEAAVATGSGGDDVDFVYVAVDLTF